MKWIFITLFFLVSCLTISIALDDQGESIGDIISYPIIGFNLLLGLLSLLFWIRQFRRTKKITDILFITIHLLIVGLILLCYKLTQDKINRAYFLYAINPNEYSHQFQYFFRTDSTLKTNGIFFWNVANDFQKFSMKGDTIFLDKILDATGIQSKIYLKTTGIHVSGDTGKILVPLDEKRNVIDSLTKFEVVDKKK
jgi:hypothetical protein